MVEQRIAKVEGEIVVIRNDIQQVKETVIVLDERQQRMHQDFTNLTSALNNAADEIAKLNRWADKRGAFIAGAIFIIGAFGTAIAGVLTILKDWIAG